MASQPTHIQSRLSLPVSKSQTQLDLTKQCLPARKGVKASDPVLQSCKHQKVLFFHDFRHCSDCGQVLSFKEGQELAVLRDKSMVKQVEVSPAELYSTMLLDEQSMTHVKFHRQDSSQQKFEMSLVDWLYKLGELFEQSNLTTQIAITYLERAYFMGLSKIGILDDSVHGQRRLAVTCLLLASKFDELDDRIPLIDHVTSQLVQEVSLNYNEVVQQEKLLLKAFNWDLMVLTPLHFVNSLLTQGVVFGDTDTLKAKQDDKENMSSKRGGVLASNKLLSSVRKYSEFFADLSMHVEELKKFKRSQVGVAAVMCARHISQIEPVWSPHFDNLTQCKQEEVEKPFRLLYQFYVSTFEGCQPYKEKATTATLNEPIKLPNSNTKPAQQPAFAASTKSSNMADRQNNFDFKKAGFSTARGIEQLPSQNVKLNLMQASKSIINLNASKKRQSTKLFQVNLKKQTSSKEGKQQREITKGGQSNQSMLSQFQSNKENVEDNTLSKKQSILQRKGTNYKLPTAGFSTSPKVINQPHYNLKSLKNTYKSIEPVQKRQSNERGSNMASDYNDGRTFPTKQQVKSMSPIQIEGHLTSAIKKLHKKKAINDLHHQVHLVEASLSTKKGISCNESTRKQTIIQSLLTQNKQFSNLFKYRNGLAKQKSAKHQLNQLVQGVSQQRRSSLNFQQPRGASIEVLSQVANNGRQDSQMLSQLEKTKDMIVQLQHNLVSNKSQSVESLIKGGSNKKRKSMIKQMAQNHLSKEIRQVKSTKPLLRDATIKNALNCTSQFQPKPSNLQALNNISCNINTLNASSLTNMGGQPQIGPKKGKKEIKVPVLNPQTFNLTKKRMLNLINHKLQGHQQVNYPLNKSNSSLVLGGLNQSSALNFQTQSARDLSHIVNLNSLPSACSNFSAINSQKIPSNRIKPRLSLPRVNQLKKGQLSGPGQCTSKSNLLVIDEEEKIKSGAKSVSSLVKYPHLITAHK